MAAANAVLDPNTASSGGANPMALAQQRLAALPMQKKMGLAGGLAMAIALLVGVALWSNSPNYEVLFSNINDKDGGAIVAMLQQQNVPYKFSEGGHAILVPSQFVHDARLKLAAQGLPRGGSIGFELMEKQKMGQSQFSEQVTYQRALEGELAQTIGTLAAVDNARVHLAIPKQSAFLRDDQKPSASVVIGLLGGRTLSPEQVGGIVHLVASSVPQLATENVSVLDQNGNLLSGNRDMKNGATLNPTQLKYVNEIEASTIRRIEAMLEPLMGRGNYRVQTAADIDFSQTEQTAETYKPNPTPDAAIRSQQMSESVSNQPAAGGVPGALANQPPAPAAAPIVIPPAPGGPAAEGAPGAAPMVPINTRKDSTTNFELDKTVQHIRQPTGQIRRLSVAVLVAQKIKTDDKGNATPVALTDAELKRINDLTREAMGFNEARGDTLNVASAPFTEVQQEVIDTPIWKDPELTGMAGDLLKYLLVAGVAAYLLFGVLKPLVRTLTEPVERDEDDVRDVTLDADGQPIALPGSAAAQLELSPEARAALDFETKLEAARTMAKNDPKAIAEVIKHWVNGDE
ncbi:flagellar basal-body MS-ring/collar protein FliF [Methyloversatilis sp.]|uniref:flagellar basal-body MS-ring/collar protein FliF n=1 Tax=Methyloversatilis sp. TaxID=2569862 RepID=UPI002732D49C|nr:flagellar basal-body MS-ring/collar protein FliF [Methyloversatilis sp.]MDP2867854.1 flagellar basal-body MS-ring/collar protein FliF [Methyloversatilis sp.]MDP3455462.1 flagellar basal-body MS-ring/collar protein FliF [Methyloversatilis sp.]MDP3577649.1 flagellar basal-body MS-ring/collar protein FliF [Methyloversatilis sp.]